ncbi:MAG: exostosin family protein [Bacteroidia bacterium]
MHLKVFTRKDWLPASKKHTIFLYPYWGEVPLPPDDPDQGRFDRWMQMGSEVYSITSDEKDADIFLLPYEFDFNQTTLTHAQELSKLAEGFGKKLMIFFINDDASPIPVPNSLVFRTSIYASKKEPHVHAIPGWSVDFEEHYRKLLKAEPEPTTLPSISYCGYVDYLDFRSHVKESGFKAALHEQLTGRKKELTGIRLRGMAVRALLRDKRVRTGFIIRTGFWGGSLSNKNQARTEYALNMLSSEYTLVMRGAGNFSYRLYEALSCGRIPLFINTDCSLPFEEFVDWRSHFVWIESESCNKIGERLQAFHAKQGREGVLKFSKDARQLYEEWLSPVGFFSNIYRYIH